MNTCLSNFLIYLLFFLLIYPVWSRIYVVILCRLQVKLRFIRFITGCFHSELCNLYIFVIVIYIVFVIYTFCHINLYCLCNLDILSSFLTWQICTSSLSNSMHIWIDMYHTILFLFCHFTVVRYYMGLKFFKVTKACTL